MVEQTRKNIKGDRPETNEIFVGNKPFMKYIIASLMQIKEEKNNSIIIKSRGKFISKAVDIAEVVKKNLSEKKINVQESIKISTDEFEDESGRKIHISTMDITLLKK
ncbi:MAG: RNA-binding protein [Nanoarchaeota archaeon]